MEGVEEVEEVEEEMLRIRSVLESRTGHVDTLIR